jgi:ferredoxin-NADP reductase
LNKLTLILRKPRQFIDGITMYRVMLYSLIALAGVALGFSAFGVLDYASFGTLALSLGLILTVTGITNLILPRLYGVTPNFESSLITAFILFFVLGAPNTAIEWAGLGLAAVFAMASKYIITWRSAHIFNPAALGVLAVSLLGIGNGAWWIADKSLFIPVLLVAFVVLYKLRRFELFAAFAIPSFAILILRLGQNGDLLNAATTALTLYPLLFLGSIMLTEPSTMPTGRYERSVFGILVGLLFASTYDLGFIASSPHLALLVGNLFAFVVTRRTSTTLKLVKITQQTPTTFSYVFEPNRPVAYHAGQYMEFTMPGVAYDSRGNRRSFSIASAPSDKHIAIGIKYYEPRSKFKTRLQDLKIGDEIIGNHVAGEFTLSKKSEPLVFIAGGIGITPFISMIREMQSNNTKRAVDLYYFVADRSEVAYKDVLKAAVAVGVNVHIRVGHEARLADEDIKKHAHAEYYLSGPPGLVQAYKDQLKSNGIGKIRTDYFTGY